ncbi:MBL fold metallo-hydrolase [Pseudorhodoplanes sp.]|uniref:MBL fold metallo-hydrolase n=1 Tax=Pseudorhodoplanes sp. TaxID=1934341 RepID=UPI002BE93CA1|nr:MBL fold metallo-hydrolase [Pseudorhodoplanes sp.]HWV41735.1 MBL fold metallo-hydrolase [Pseudorhodoplanes sp.]
MTGSPRVHRWRVGDVTITRVIEAEGLRAPEYMFRGLTPDIVQGHQWLRPNFATEAGQLISSIHAFVIESADRRIIVDTCVGNDKARRMPIWNGLQTAFLDDLAAAGYPPERIDTVLCTHLHVDHVGWNTRLVDGRWVPTFPNARYIFGRIEFEHWSRGPEVVKTGDAPVAVAEIVMECDAIYQDSILPIVEAGLHELVEYDHQLTSEIRLMPTPGHSPGHVSVVVSSKGETAVITGDLMHHPIQCAMPGLASNFDFDVEMARKTRAEFLARHADKPILVLGTHFATPTAGYIVSTGDSFRFSWLPRE